MSGHKPNKSQLNAAVHDVSCGSRVEFYAFIFIACIIMFYVGVHVRFIPSCR